MATAAQILANCANAQKSTGPSSPEGKARSAHNARKHGLYSREFVILPGHEQEFQEFFSGFENDLQPANTIEHAVFLQIAQAAWTIRRCNLAEVQLQLTAINPAVDPILDDAQEFRLRRIDTCRRRAQSSFQRMMKELRLLQTERQFRLETYPEGHDDPTAETIHTISPAINFHTIHTSQRADMRAGFQGRLAELEQDLAEMEALRSNIDFEQTKPISIAASGGQG